MKLTPKKYESLNRRWISKRSSQLGKTVCSSSCLQSQITEKFDSSYFKYIPCPLCGEDKFTILHKKTFYAVKQWENFLLNILIGCIGKKYASHIISFLLGRKVDFFRRSYQVAQCASCNFIFRNPTYTAAMVDAAYNEQDYSKFLLGSYSANRVKLYKYILKVSGFNKRTANFNSAKILDIGCGTGLFLNVMKTSNWDTYGLDFSEDAIEYGRKEFGLKNIRAGNLLDNTFDKEFFDAVSLISVAAHLENPLSMFRRIYTILKPGGLLLIWTVNAGSLKHKYLLGNWGGVFLKPFNIFRLQFNANSIKKDRIHTC